MSFRELCFLPAVEQARLIADREIKSVELVEAHLQQIQLLNPKVNAIVTLVAERALRTAREADEQQVRDRQPGILHGLPVVHKDLHETRNIRTTYGSPIYRNYVPTFDALIVDRLKRAGAVTLGKSNTPEFGAGSQTFNTVFGATKNPYNLSRTCGGSSGGAAVALACGMTSIADGSDLGGSLRNPASFSNVVGLRPSAGRVPVWPAELAWFNLSVQGPMARTVQDVALTMAAIAGPHPSSPIANTESGDIFLRPLAREWKGVRVAWSPALGGLPVENEVLNVLEKAIPVFQSLGCEIELSEPNLQEADEVFRTLRAWRFHHQFEGLLRTHREHLKDTIQWNADEGAKLSGADIARAEQLRTRLFHRLRRFFQHFDFLLAPVVQVLPFDLDQPYVREINGQELETYIDWMKSCYLISATGLPAASIPAGFSKDNLPVGIQIIGRHQDDWGVLQLGYAFQQATEFWKRHPLNNQMFDGGSEE